MLAEPRPSRSEYERTAISRRCNMRTGWRKVRRPLDSITRISRTGKLLDFVDLRGIQSGTGLFLVVMALANSGFSPWLKYAGTPTFQLNQFSGIRPPQVFQLKKEEMNMKARTLLLLGLFLAAFSLLATNGKVR